MMAAVQPFISGAISKTVNLPQRRHGRGHRGRPTSRPGSSGLKAVAIYRDGCKRTPAAHHLASDKAHAGARRRRRSRPRPVRRRLPDERQAITHKFSIAGHEGYITVGLYEDGDAGRDLRADGQGRLDDLGPDGQLRHRHLAGAAVRRAAAGARATSSATRASSPRASPGTRRSRSPSRSSTTSSAGWR